MKTLDLKTLWIYTTFNYTYPLLDCKGHVQISSNNIIIYMERKVIEYIKKEHIGFKYN